MERSRLIYFPTIIKYAHFIDSKNRVVFKILLALKTTFSIVLAICIFATLLSNKEGENSLAKFHNAAIITLFLGTGLPLLAKRKELLEFATFIAEPIKDHFNSYRFPRQYKHFVMLTNVFSNLIATYIFLFGMTLPALPALTTLLGVDLTGFGADLFLLADNNSMWSFVLANIMLPIGYFMEMTFMGTWFLLMSCLVLKFDLSVDLMVDGLATLDELANKRCNEVLISRADSSRLPLCQKCKEFQRSRESSNTTRLRPLECCTIEYDGKVMERCYSICLYHVIVKHQNLLK